MNSQQTFEGYKELYISHSLEIISDHTQAEFIAGVKYSVDVDSETEEDTNAQYESISSSDIEIEYYYTKDYEDVHMSKTLLEDIKKHIIENLY